MSDSDNYYDSDYDDPDYGSYVSSGPYVRKPKSTSTRDLARSQINIHANPVNFDEDFFSMMLLPTGLNVNCTKEQFYNAINISKYDELEELDIKCDKVSTVKAEIGRVEHLVESFSPVEFDQVTQEQEFFPRLSGGTIPGENEKLVLETIDRLVSQVSELSIHEDIKNTNSRIVLQPKFKLEAIDPKKDPPMVEKRSNYPHHSSLKELKFLFDSPVYKRHKELFFQSVISSSFQESPIVDFSKFNAEETKLIDQILNFSDKQLEFDPNKGRIPRIVYCPSGGGKSTLANGFMTDLLGSKKKKDPLKYVDIDDIVKDYFSWFQLIQKVCDQTGDYRIMNRFFQRILDVKMRDNKFCIYLLCHPKQVPNCFRFGFNELVLFPLKPNWGLRFFNNNLFSLLSVKNKAKIFCDFNNYDRVITRYFGYH